MASDRRLQNTTNHDHDHPASPEGDQHRRRARYDHRRHCRLRTPQPSPSTAIGKRPAAGWVKGGDGAGEGQDLERALCHFWLCGTCAKQENCEFLHHLPKDVDMASLNAVLACANVQPGTGPLVAFMGAGPYNNGMGMMVSQQQQQQQMQQDEFPALRYNGANDSGVGGVGRGKKFPAYVNNPSRTRFAAAVKKPAPPPHHQLGDDASANGTAPRIQERPWVCC
ncbi:hypothetical protein D9613_012128 [Agrocybe pediades]|uniref:C3H1-type domain-containing protein n=1 Tax=Agrocybe pediades TaxID=84607 RepID=A0A8H4R3P5_9AGAR|nr:hypothetical protein D9613_012128 [Agrocybe pediades]